MKQYYIIISLIVGSIQFCLQQSFAQSFIDIQIEEDCSLKMFFDKNSANCEDLTLEWSNDGKKFNNFEEINITNLNINGQIKLENNPQSIHNYFRLKMTDCEGIIVYSNTVHLLNDCGLDGYMQVYPNPIQVNDRLNISFFTDKMFMDITLYQQNGEVIHTMLVETPDEWNAMSIDLSEVESGEYVVEIGDIGITTFTIMANNQYSSFDKN